MICDVVLDTNYLAELIRQFYSDDFCNNTFSESNIFKKTDVRKINSIIKSHIYETGLAVIVSSSLSFIEILRKFDEIFDGSVSIDEFKAFINQTPEWFLIENIDFELLYSLAQIPSHVYLNGREFPIELTDSIHVATAYSRDNYIFYTTDQRLLALEILKK